MIPIEKLKTQHHDICELAEVLLALMHDESARETGVTRELFARLAKDVKEHFELEERTLYAELMNHSDKEIKNTTWRFLGGAPHLKKYFSDYVRNCCLWEEGEKDCEAFVKETDEVFALLKERIQVENKLFYPLVEKLQAGQ